MSAWLSRQRKGDLQRLADEAGLKIEEGLLKDDIAALLDAHLRDNQPSLSHVPSLKEFYERTGSPLKKERTTSNAPVVVAGVTSDAEVPKPRKRRVTKVKEEFDSVDEATPQKSLASRTPRALQRLAERAPLPPSPAVVTDAIERQTAAIQEQANKYWEESGLTELSDNVRVNLSSAIAVQVIAFILEGTGLRRETLHLRHAFNMPAIDALNVPSYPVSLPDFFELLTPGFWGPTTLWTFTSFVIPLIAAYYVNLTLKKSSTGALKTRSTSYQADPFTFSIVKALVTYLVYAHHVTFGLFQEQTIATVDRGFFGGYQSVLIASGVGILFSLYETGQAALQK